MSNQHLSPHTTHTMYLYHAEMRRNEPLDPL
jgi:hypothetical protein